MAGVKGRSGRKKSISSLVNEALGLVDQDLPGIFKALIKRAKEGDREAQIYLIDRRLGRPRQEIDQRIKGIIKFTADELEEASRIPQLEERRLISQYIGNGVEVFTEQTAENDAKEG